MMSNIFYFICSSSELSSFDNFNVVHFSNFNLKKCVPLKNNNENISRSKLASIAVSKNIFPFLPGYQIPLKFSDFPSMLFYTIATVSAFLVRD